MSLLARLKAGTRNEKTIRFPGSGQDVVLKVLSNEDVQRAEFATEGLFRKAGIELNQGTVETYEKEKTIQLLHLALRDPEDTSKPLAASVDELRRLLTQDEKDALVEEYLSFEQECAPNLESLSEAEFLDLVAEVKKRPEEAASSISSISLLRRLTAYLASRPQNSLKASGSTS